MPLKRQNRSSRKKPESIITGPSKKQLLKQADLLWSGIIKTRANGICQKCGRKGHQAHHIFGRRHYHVRHNIDNGIFLCAGCHTLHPHESAHKAPEKFRDFLLIWMGEKKYEELKQKAYRVSKPDYALAILGLKFLQLRKGYTETIKE